MAGLPGLYVNDWRDQSMSLHVRLVRVSSCVGVSVCLYFRLLNFNLFPCIYISNSLGKFKLDYLLRKHAPGKVKNLCKGAQVPYLRAGVSGRWRVHAGVQGNMGVWDDCGTSV